MFAAASEVPLASHVSAETELESVRVGVNVARDSPVVVGDREAGAAVNRCLDIVVRERGRPADIPKLQDILTSERTRRR